MDELVLTFEGLKLHGLNGNDGLIRQHFRKAKEVKTHLWLLIKEQTKHRFKCPVVIYFDRYTTKLMDWDNHAASFKHMGDSLVDADVIIDDKPSIIVHFFPRQFKVNKVVENKIEVTIMTHEKYLSLQKPIEE